MFDRSGAQIKGWILNNVVWPCVCNVQILMLVFASVFLIHNTWAVSTAVIDCQGTLLTALRWCLCVCVCRTIWVTERKGEPDREWARNKEVICDFVTKYEVAKNSLTPTFPFFFFFWLALRWEVIWINLHFHIAVNFECRLPGGCGLFNHTIALIYLFENLDRDSA